MSDFAFNNYCIHCDKLCPTNSVYCSEECKSIEYQSSIQTSNTFTAASFEQYPSAHHHNESQYHHNNSVCSASSATSNKNEYAPNDMVSPLLTPALYLQQQQQQQQQLQSVSSPLMLASHVDVETKDDSHYDLNYFDLNYSVKSNTNYTSNKTSTELINSTSHNYRKWLTAL